MNINEENNKQLGKMYENLKKLRKEKSWSIGELSEISDIDANILYRIENGEDFEFQHLHKLCIIYQIALHEIFL